MLSNSNVFLTGDLGGTNCRLQLVRINKDSPDMQFIKEEKYKSTDFPRFIDILKLFLSDILEENYPKKAVFGTPGQVINGSLSMQNIKQWPPIVVKDLIEELKVENVIILNDCVAIGHGILALGPDDIYNINKEAKGEEGKIKAVIIPGTGVGQTLLVPNDLGVYRVWPNEGSHSTFGPVNTLQSEYLEYYK